MVGSWLLKVVVGIALAGFILIEVGSPFIARAQADDAANEIATETAFRLGKSFNQATLEKACAEEGDDHDVEVVLCDFDSTTEEVVIRVRKDARSVILANVSATEDWYHPEVTARSKLK